MAATITRAQRRAQAAAAETSAPVASTPVAPSFTLRVGDARLLFAGHFLTVGKDRLLPIFCHIEITVDGNEVRVRSTDRYRATETTVTDDGNRVQVKGDGSFLVDGDTLKRVMATLPKAAREADHPVTFAVEGEQLRVATLDGSSSVALYRDGEFPKIGHILSTPTSDTVEFFAFDPAYLGDLCKFPQDKKASLVLRSCGPAKPAIATWTVETVVHYRHLIMQRRLPD